MSKSVNHKALLEAVAELAASDFAEDMCFKRATLEEKQCPTCFRNHKDPFSQHDAAKMADLIGQIYTISHKVHCEACR